MPEKIRIKDIHALRVTEGFDLADVDPASTPFFRGDDDDLDQEYGQHDDTLEDLQTNLWANAKTGNQETGSVLLILQGMDTSGKGGAIRHVFKPLHPLGYRTAAFGKPSEEEAKHDFLWRVTQHMPARGEIVAFDRSHYEDVLVQRVEKMAPEEEIERRYGAIVDFERAAAGFGTRIIKVMLHISPEFQKENLLDRLQDPEKFWKFHPSDLETRAKWNEHMAAYQLAMERTSTEQAPWYCVPGDNKKYARTVIKHLLVDALRDLQQPWPSPDYDPAELLRRVEEER